MSRSKHTDPRPVRSARRVAAPLAGRGEADGEHGIAVEPPSPHAAPAWPWPRIVVHRPCAGFHHPAGKRDVMTILRAIGSVGWYGLRTVELGPAPAGGRMPASTLVFGRYEAPGAIVLFAQPLPPWRLPALLSARAARRLERAGARLTRLAAAGATLVDWPPGALRRFMLEEVLLHEIGHHVLQHDKGKRPRRIARTRDHEAYARRFALRLRAALGLCDA